MNLAHFFCHRYDRMALDAINHAHTSVTPLIRRFIKRLILINLYTLKIFFLQN